MELVYTNESIMNEDGISCFVLDVDKIDFSTGVLGRKKTITKVVRAYEGEVIETINSKGLVESSYVTKEGDAIFINGSRDVYAPRDENGVSWKFDSIASYGYDICKRYVENNRDCVDIISNKTSMLLPHVILIPSCIKNAWGEGFHQFLFEGATLKQDRDTLRVTGIDSQAYDRTWEVLDTVKQKS